MDNLPPDVQSLLARTRRRDDPTARDRERVRQRLGVALSATGATASVLVSKSAVAAQLAAVPAEVIAPSVATATLGVGAEFASTGVAAAAGGLSAGAAGAGSVAVATGGKVAVGTTALAAAKGNGLAVWLVSIGLVGAGATVAAPRVAQWVNEGTVVPPIQAAEPQDLASHNARRIGLPPKLDERPIIEPAIPKGKEPVALGESVVPQSPARVPSVTKSNKSPLAPELADNIEANNDVSLLTQAQQALAAHDATRSLFLLSQHASRYPTSALGAERAAVRVLALCQLGRVSEAQKAAAVFYRTGSGSPLTPRVQASCIAEPSASHDSLTTSGGSGN